MSKVRFRWDYWIDGKRYSPGSVYELDDTTAEGLIKAGHCVLAEPPEPVVPAKPRSRKKKAVDHGA